MTSEKVFRVLRDAAGWTVEGDRHPQTFLEKDRAIERAERLALQATPSEVLILSEGGDIEENRRFDRADGQAAAS